MKKKNNRIQKRKFMSHDKNTVYFNSQVVEIVEQTECANGKFKTVFKVAKSEENEPKTCILWERSCMQVGDKIKITTVEDEFVYTITKMFTVESDAVEVLDQDMSKKEITIVTCTNGGKQRLIVKGEIL